MKLKKVLSVMLATAMVFSLTACGGNDGASSGSGAADSGAAESGTDAGDAGDAAAEETSAASSGDKLVVWTLAADLEQFAEYYKEKQATRWRQW